MRKRLFLKKQLLTILLTIVNEGSSLRIVKERLSLTIVYETTKFFEKKLHATVLNVVLHEVKRCGGVKTP